MFAASLCDSGLDKGSRRWTTLFSFGLQAVAVAALLTLPFLSTQGLPELSFATHVMVPLSQAIMPQRPTTRAPSSLVASGTILHISASPNYNSRGLPKPDETGAMPPSLLLGQSDSPGVGRIPGVESGTGTAVPLLAATTAAHPRVSVMMEGNLVYRVQPQYPSIAIQAGISGPVVLHALISRQGNIENLQVLTGPPLLVKAAMDAVRQWRYRPYALNGEPVEVDTQVTVNFVLGGR
jgi:protein TonB